MLIFGRQVFKHLCESCKNPSVASSPEVLFAIGAFVLGIYVFTVAVVEILLGVKHYAVAIGDVFIKFVEVLLVACDFVKFSHYGHNHVESVGPPPVVVFGCRHFIFHNFTCASNAFVVGQDVVEVGISLEAYLPVAKEYVVIAFAIAVFPVGAVVALGAFPLVVLGPFFGVFTVGVITSEEVGLHVAGVISGIVPKGSYLGSVVALPIGVDLVDDGTHFLGLLGCCREGGH